jgi:hypothetical protein
MAHCRPDIVGAALASVLLLVTSARAETSGEDSFPVTAVVALSSGYSVPIGSPDSGAPDAVVGILKGLVPIDLEVGVQLGAHWRVLAYGGVGLLVRNVPDCRTIECGDKSLHAGAKVAFLWRGPGGWDFIAALGAGWHRLELSTTAPDTTTDAAATGVEGLLEFAALYPVTPVFALGPFIGGSIVSSSGWSNVVDGQASQTSGNHLDGAFNFGFKLELRL